MKPILRNRNEVMQGPSPECLKTLKNFDPSQIAYYADGYYSSILATELSKEFGIPQDRVVVCYGTEDFLRTVFDSLDFTIHSVLTHEFYYGYYQVYLEAKNIRLRTFQMHSKGETFSFNIQDCIQQYKQYNPKVILLTSPNNPTGNSIQANELEQILETVTSETLVVLDEAYWGFNPSYDQNSFLMLLNQYPNLVILRSFSKYYALASLRIGFALCGTEVKRILNYQDFYLGMSRLLEEVAIAALHSKEYYYSVANEIEAERARLIVEIRKLKYFKAYDSNANLIFIEANDNSSIKLEQTLRYVSIVSAKKSFQNYWRISIGLPDVNDAILNALRISDKL